MEIEIANKPSFAIAHVTLSPQEQVRAGAGSMVSKSAGIEIETKAEGGFLKGLRRSAMGGESFFMNTFTAGNQGGTVSFAQASVGDIVHWPLSGQTVYLQSGSYLASGTTIDIDSSWGGAKTFFSKEGLFVLKVHGAGDLLVSSYGAIESRELAHGETYTVDTGHMVAWTEGIHYDVKKVGGWKSTMLSGEGLVAELTGPGTIYTQTRSIDDFVDWIASRLPKSN